MPDPYEEALRRLREVEGGIGEEGDGLATLVGRTVLDLNTGFIGIVKTRLDRRMGRVYWLSGEGGRAQNLNVGATLVDPNTRQVMNVDPTGGVEPGGKLSEGDLERLFGVGGAGGGGGGGGGGYAAPQWRPGELELEQQEQARRGQELQLERDSLKASIAQSERDLAWAKEEFARAQAAEDRRAAEYAQLQMEMLEKRLENDRRTLGFQMGMQERGTLIQEKAETGREIMRLGPDPFRQAAILSGGVQRGTTPQQTAVEQGQAFMNQPLPRVSMGMDVAQLEAAIAQMQGQGMTQPQFGGFGMAGGGVIEMEHKDGAFSMKPKMSYLVGEGKHGEGLKAGTAEILTIGDGKVEVTPFGGGAYGGLEQSVFQGLSPLYSDFGFSTAPTAGQFQGKSRLTADPRLVKFGDAGTIYMIDPYTGQKRPIAGAGVFNRSGFDWGDIEKLGAGAATQWATGPTMGSAYGLDPAALSQMGISPDLVTFGGEGTIYHRDPSGQLRALPSWDMFKEAGFLPQDVVNMAAGTKGAFEFGSTLTAPPPVAAQEGAFGALGTVMVESTTGAILPAIHKVAQQLAQWKAAGDYRYDLALSAYGNALDPRTGLPLGGISPQYIDSIVSAATPRAGAFGGRRIGFTGGWT